MAFVPRRVIVSTVLLVALPVETIAQFSGPGDLVRPKASTSVVDRLRNQDFGAVQVGAVWRDEFQQPIHQLSVCWESPRSKHDLDRSLVREAITETWERHAAITFTGWGLCESAHTDIRITVGDVNPHTKGLGNQLKNIPGGMVLNFDFIAWGKECRSNETQRQLCIRAIAVHEFGHALAFAHEHNRDDRERTCLERAQGPSGDTHLTPYDPDSVMNYCNPRYANFGKLSFLDVVSVQTLYGVRK